MWWISPQQNVGTNFKIDFPQTFLGFMRDSAKKVVSLIDPFLCLMDTNKLQKNQINIR